MTRIQRARALRLGYALAAILFASHAAAADSDHATVLRMAKRVQARPVPAAEAREALAFCAPGSNWLERSDGAWASKVAPAGWFVVCGSPEGRPVEVINVKAATCNRKADLDYIIAELVGAEPDAAWEDSFAVCTAQ